MLIEAREVRLGHRFVSGCMSKRIQDPDSHAGTSWFGVYSCPEVPR